MLIAADIGNTNIKFGVFNLNSDEFYEPLCTFMISSLSPKSIDEYIFTIRSLLSAKGIDIKINHSVISSVVPSLTHNIAAALHEITGRQPFYITAGTKTGFTIYTDNPAELGSDIVCNVAATLKLLNPPAVIVDMGTATTISFIDDKKQFIGAAILPGATLALNSLCDSTELLGKYPLRKPKSILGKNTADSVMAGVIYGNVFTINSYIEHILRSKASLDINKELRYVATGGNANKIIPLCNNEYDIIENLTIVGAAVLYKKNQPYKKY